MPSSAVVAATKQQAPLLQPPDEGLKRLIRGSLSRQILFFWLFIAASLNSLVALASFPEKGESWWRAGLGLFGMLLPLRNLNRLLHHQTAAFVTACHEFF